MTQNGEVKRNGKNGSTYHCLRRAKLTRTDCRSTLCPSLKFTATKYISEENNKIPQFIYMSFIYSLRQKNGTLVLMSFPTIDLNLTDTSSFTFVHDVFILLTECDGDPKVIVLKDRYSANSGTIYSPGYPNSYGTNKNCKWRITALHGQKVLIYFTFFDLEYDAFCSFDSVQFDSVQFGEYFWNSNPRVSKSCGSSLPLPVYSQYDYIDMRFRSDDSVQGKGFAAHYRTLNDSSSK